MDAVYGDQTIDLDNLDREQLISLLHTLNKFIDTAHQTVENLQKQVLSYENKTKQDDKEIGEFQQNVLDKCVEFVGKENAHLIDGTGEDSGDWRDLTLCEIQQAFNIADEKREA